MTQAFTTKSLADGSDPVETNAASTSRAFMAAQALRAKALRQKRWRRLVIWGIIIGATLAFPAWGVFFATPRYAAETRFSVRGAISFPPPTSTATPVTSLFTNGQQPLSSSVGFVDGFAANDFIQSRDCIQRVAKLINLRSILRVKAKDGDQALFDAYNRAVASRFDIIEQINVVKVSAFSPAESRLLADTLLRVTEEFVEREDDIGAKNTLAVSENELRHAREAAKKAEDAIAAWRMANHDFDPEAETTMVMTLIGTLEQQLATAQVNYEKIRALGNPDHPMLKPAEMQVNDVERQIALARARLTGNNNSQAARLKAYTQLKAEVAFQEANSSANQSFYLQALHDENIMRRFVSVIARPVEQNRPSSPVLWMLALQGLLAGFVLALLALIGMRLFHSEREELLSRQNGERSATNPPRR